MCQCNTSSLKFSQYTLVFCEYLFLINKLLCFSLCREDAKNPCFWSRVCLHNMMLLAKEATTKRRILESLFLYFDNENLWSLEDGLAFPVLKDMQFLAESSGIYVKFSLMTIFKCPILFFSQLMLFDRYIVLNQCYTSFSPFKFSIQIWSFLFWFTFRIYEKIAALIKQ